MATLMLSATTVAVSAIAAWRGASRMHVLQLTERLDLMETKLEECEASRTDMTREVRRLHEENVNLMRQILVQTRPRYRASDMRDPGADREGR